MSGGNALGRSGVHFAALLAAGLVTLMLIRQCATPASGTGEAPIQATGSDHRTACYREHFPLAFGVPDSAVPAEVKLYCARRWNFEALASVQAAADAAQFDVSGALIRGTSGAQRQALEQVLPLAEEQAKLGPPNMLLVWRIHKMLPVFYAVQPGSSDEQIVVSQFDADDVQRARNASNAIDWDRPAELEGRAGQPPMRLRDLAVFIVQRPAGG